MKYCKDCKYYDDVDGEIGECIKQVGKDYFGLYCEKMDEACEHFKSLEEQK